MNTTPARPEQAVAALVDEFEPPIMTHFAFSVIAILSVASSPATIIAVMILTHIACSLFDPSSIRRAIASFIAGSYEGASLVESLFMSFWAPASLPFGSTVIAKLGTAATPSITISASS